MEILESITAETVLQKRKELANAVRIYSKQQVSIWQQIPYMALQAYGKGGFNGSYLYAYTKGLWEIGRVYINLETGEITDREGKPSMDHMVLGLELTALDAVQILQKLQEEVNKFEDSPITAFQTDCSTVDFWRKNEARLYNLSPNFYTRRKEVVTA